jgi:hypothetical protein
MLRYKMQTYLKATVLALALILIASAIDLLPGDILAQSPDTECAKDGNTCPMTGDFGPISVDAAPPGAWVLTAPGAPAFSALVYDPDFKLIEQEARARLKRGLDAREALSPYKGNVEFDTYVKKFDYQAGWNRAYSGYDPYGDTLTLIDLIGRADQDLREARDLYAYLLVYAPEYRFRTDSYYISDVHTNQGFTEPLCGVTDKEDPDPADPTFSGQVLDPVIDWCNFRARLHQSVREAANLRMIFGQQFMVDAMGLHFSGTEFYGGEEAVRGELAQLRAAKHQYELAEQGLAEALDRAVGSGCYVSDFYTQSEWSLMSRAIENQETAQHHIAVRLSYMDVASPEQVGQADAAAQEAFRQASVNGYIKLIGMASLGAAQPLGIGCNVGERPDGQLAAEMALNLAETRRKSHELADGRNIFGFDVTFTPARPYKSSVAMNCSTTSPATAGCGTRPGAPPNTPRSCKTTRLTIPGPLMTRKQTYWLKLKRFGMRLPAGSPP